MSSASTLLEHFKNAPIGFERSPYRKGGWFCFYDYPALEPGLPDCVTMPCITYATKEEALAAFKEGRAWIIKVLEESPDA